MQKQYQSHRTRKSRENIGLVKIAALEKLRLVRDKIFNTIILSFLENNDFMFLLTSMSVLHEVHAQNDRPC